MHVVFCKCTSIPVVFRGSCDGISAASLVLVLRSFIEARIIFIPFSHTIHWLATALSGALFVSLCVWTPISIVSSIGADRIDSASSVLVVVAIMVASAIGTPVTSTVHWLAATLSDAINLVVLKWAFLST